MKILLVLKGKLEFLPPIINLCYDLKDLNYDVVLLVEQISNYNKQKLVNYNIEIHDFNFCYEKKIINLNSKKTTIVKKLILYPIRKLRNYKLKKMLWQEIEKIKYDYLWICSLDTAICLGKRVLSKEYFISMHELSFDKRFSCFLNYANKVFTPEINRSLILRSRYSLKTTPFVLPNKNRKETYSLNKEINKVLESIPKQKKILLYQGYISPERNLIPFAKAIENLQSSFIFIIQSHLCIDQNQYDILSKMKNTKFIPSMPAPEHLAITEKAYIGIVTYYHKDLNCEFCAPNKVFEYSGFGIPMIANDVAGLLNTVGKYNAGISLNLDISNIQDITETILKIDRNYKYYSDNSKKLYESVDRKKILKESLKDLKK